MALKARSPLALYRLHGRRRTLRGRTPHRARTDGRTPGVFPRVCRTAPTSAQHSRLLRRPCIAATALAAASRTQRPTLNRRNSAWHSTVHRRPTCERASTQAYEKRRGTFPHRHSIRVSSLSVRPHIHSTLLPPLSMGCPGRACPQWSSRRPESTGRHGPSDSPPIHCPCRGTPSRRPRRSPARRRARSPS